MTSADDPYPSNEEIRRANEGLIAIVRDRLPMGFYRQADQWSKWSTAALVRMADTVEAAMSLMAAGLEVDARTLLRSLYEQVVTFAWLGLDRWAGRALTTLPLSLEIGEEQVRPLSRPETCLSVDASRRAHGRPRGDNRKRVCDWIAAATGRRSSAVIRWSQLSRPACSLRRLPPTQPQPSRGHASVPPAIPLNM